MSRGLARLAAASAVVAVAWFGWDALGVAAARLGLGWLDPLSRVALAMAALTLADVLASRLFPPRH